MKRVLLWFVNIYAIILVYSHNLKKSKCGVKKYLNKTMHKVDIYGEHKRMLQTANWQPIRIYLDFTMLDSQNLNATWVKNIKLSLAQTVSIFQSLLTVKRSPKNLIVTTCQDGITIGKTITTVGVAADVIIIPYFDGNEDSGVEASAGPCANDLTTYRPVMGSIGYTNITDFKKTNAFEYYTLLALHELTHILVFIPDSFANFIDSNGNLLGMNKVVANYTVNGVLRTQLITPKLLQVARNYYGCNNMTGVELENQGGDGTAGSHWESRTMLGDYMIGQSYEENVISDMTLALYEDSGWYKPNYYTGGLFRYGKNQGCGFLNTKCISNNSTKYNNEFCLISGASSCTSGRLAKGYCSSNFTSSRVPKEYQYFSDPTVGGYTLADFCPTINSDDQNGQFFSNLCTIGVSNYPPNLAEVIGTSSSCFISSLTPPADNSTAIYQGKNFAICYATTCNSDNTYSVTIGKNTVKCPTAGGTVSINGFNGLLNCVDYNLICTQTTPLCSSTLTCALNKVLSANLTYNYTPNNTQNLGNNFMFNFTYDTTNYSAISVYNGSNNLHMAVFIINMVIGIIML